MRSCIACTRRGGRTGQAAFPGTTQDGKVDRAKLAARVVDDPAALKHLESIVHPLVSAAKQRFLAEAETNSAPVAVLDVPLLFETGGEQRVDAVVVVSAPVDIQRQRVLARPGMTAEKLDALLARQIPDAVKRKRADFVVDTSRGLDAARAGCGRFCTPLLRCLSGSRFAWAGACSRKSGCRFPLRVCANARK